jgi:hypothetical protein
LASGQSFNDLDTYGAVDQVKGAEGQYTEGMLSSLFL